MEEFKSALHEIHATQNKVILLLTFLRAMIVFLLCFVVLKMFNLYFWGLSVTIGMIYFALTLHKDIHTKNLLEVERKNPLLAEKLRTAADYADVVNYVVSTLQVGVVKLLKNVPISTFIDMRKLTYLLLGVMLSSGAVLFVTSNDIIIYDLGSAISSFSFQGDRNMLEGIVPNSLLDAGVSVDDLNDDAQINEMALSALKEKPKRDLYLPEDIFEQSDKSFEETLPKKKRIYIRKYFGEIRKYGME